MIYEEWIASELAKLSPKHFVAFAAACAERVQENYHAFAFLEI